MNARVRTALLLVVLTGLAAFYVYSNPNLISGSGESAPVPSIDKSSSLPFDDDTKAKIRHYFDGIKVEPQENSVAVAVKLDHSVGRPQLSQGKYKEAYLTYQKVLAISYLQGNLMGVGIGLSILSDVSERANQPDEALHAGLLSYHVAQTMKNKEEMGVAELRLGRLLQQRDLSLSMMFALRAKENLAGTRYKEDYARLLKDLADRLRDSGEIKKASLTYAEAWDLTRALGDSPSQKWTKSEVGMSYADDLTRQKEYEKATQALLHIQNSFSPSERTSDIYTHVLTRLAGLYALQKRDAEATRYFTSAYGNYELSRAQAPGDEGRAKLDGQHKGLIDDFADHFIQANDHAAAVAILESNKARTLNDILEDPSQKEVHRQWKEMEQRHAKEVARLIESEIDEAKQWQKGFLPKNLVTLWQEQYDERRKLQGSLQLKEIMATRSLSKEQVEDIKRNLPPDMAVLSFFLRADRASVFVVTQNSLRHVPLPAKPGEYRRAAQQLRIALTNPYNDFYREPAQLLYRQLLEPVIHALPGSIRIVVYSPDGIFSRIPLAALMDGESFVGERYGFYVIPSLRYLASPAAIKTPPVKAGIACVDPDVANARLPFQQETGRFLKKMYGERMTALVGKECSETKLTGAIKSESRPSFVHIGAHGIFHPYNAMDSSIWLSAEEGNSEPGHRWNARAMAALDMGRIDLVTLSSCETGLTDPKMERDVFGIARALFFAGATKIIAPLWMVHDQATAELMRAFHAAYFADTPAVIALQRAQRELIRTEKYRHPFYWSGFVLTGGGK